MCALSTLLTRTQQTYELTVSMNNGITPGKTPCLILDTQDIIYYTPVGLGETLKRLIILN